MEPFTRVSDESIVHVQGHRLKPTRDEKRTRLWAFNKPRKVLTASEAVSEANASKVTTSALLRQVSARRHPDARACHNSRLES